MRAPVQIEQTHSIESFGWIMPGDSELNAAGRSGLTTLATKVYGEIREDIVAGVLPPGAKLKILLLRARYDCGATPIREH